MTMSDVEWRPVPGFEGIYDVSPLGLLRQTPGSRTRQGRIRPGLILKTQTDTSGYSILTLVGPDRSITKKVHRLVAHVFIGPCLPGYEVNHIDGDKRNNAVANLEYVTGQQNKAHAWRTGLRRARGQEKRNKLSDSDIAEIRRAASSGETRQSIANRFSVVRSYVVRIVAGKARQSECYKPSAK